jgi:hypothetical protein
VPNPASNAVAFDRLAAKPHGPLAANEATA